MRYFKLTELNIPQFTTKAGIYSLRIRQEDRTKYIIINETSWYPDAEWTIDEAIDHYLSKEGRESRFEAWYSAWCD